MHLAYLQNLVDYHYWARDRVLEAAARLDAVRYGQPLGGSFGSVRDTLNHVYGAEVLWLRRWQGDSPAGFPEAMPESAAALRAAWKRQEAAMRAFLSTLDDAALERIIGYRNLAGVPGESALWEMLAHVVNHASYHRGQVTTLLRQLGAAPPASTDLIAYRRAVATGDARPRLPVVTIRRITAADVATVAALHATSWRRAYRGMLSDAYLDGDLEAERRAAWTTRLADPDFGFGWIAHADTEPVGFVYVRHERDPHWGVHIDNLHVLVAHQGLGVGRRLLHTVGQWGAEHAAGERMHLWVIAANSAARGFYACVGGEEVELVDRAAGDGNDLPEHRVAWHTPSALVQATTVQATTVQATTTPPSA